jgi:hypothetical protein
VIGELARIDDLDKYVHLRERLLADGAEAALDAAFQRLYRTYWRMNVARLGDSFYSKYFTLLAECRRAGYADISEIVRALATADDSDKQSLQFSFATKLAHMVDPRIPVYDSFVAAFYFYNPPPSNRPFEERLAALLTFHSFLQAEYARVIDKGLLGEALRGFRAHFQIGNAICDERLIDWLLWGWVSLLRGEAQRRGEALYA